MAKTKKTKKIPSIAGLYLENDGFEMASQLEMSDSETPVQMFKKDIINVGKYTHPKHKWELDVTPERMDGWIKTFNKMKDNGVDVEVVVDHRGDAEAVRGYVTDMYRNGNALFANTEIRGQDSIDLVQKVRNVSILVDRDYKDGKGNDYGEAISHVSIVQQPVAPGQSEFEVVRKAASKADSNSSVINLFHFNLGDQNMDEKLLKALKELIGAGDDFTAETALSQLSAGFKKLTDENKTFSTKVTEHETTIAGLKKTTPTKIDPNLAEQMGKTGEDRLNNLVAAGKLTPAAAKLACSKFIGASGTRNLMSLSYSEGGSSLDHLCEVLQANDLVELGEKVKTMSLSRETPGGDEEKSYDDAVEKEMIEEASTA